MKIYPNLISATINKDSISKLKGFIQYREIVEQNNN